ncbi:MAG TPA: universal stress protein [Streptosporangiaceae bacterium]|jgi:nucleotide-binding universal stress UspA family protein
MDLRRVVTGVSGSAGSLQALRFAAEMARSNQAELVVVLAWVPPGGDMADRRMPSAELRRIWRQAARERLSRAVELAIGGPPADVEFEPEIVRGEAGPALIEVACQPGDVLVIGSGRHGPLRRMLACKVSRYCLGHGRCPVIAVPPAQLADDAHGLRWFMLRRRLVRSGNELHPAGA